MKTLNIEAKTDNLISVLEFIDEELDRAGCDLKAKLQIDIAAEELFVNVSNYSYYPYTGDVSISIRIVGDPARAEITFIDSGMPYNPLERKDPDVGLSAEERQIGGLGVFMVKKSMDEISYEYKNGQNILKIKKHI